MISVNADALLYIGTQWKICIFLYILSNGSLSIATLKNFKSIGCEIRKLLYIALRNHTNKKVPHGAILILCSLTEAMKLGIFHGNSSPVLC